MHSELNDNTDCMLLSPGEMGRADRLTIDAGTPGPVLMERAGRFVADAAARMAPRGGRILALCGPGNNGGDGFVAARLLKATGFGVDVVLLKDPSGLGGDARAAFEAMELPITRADAPGFVERLADADVVVDALFGAGLDRDLSVALIKLVEQVNQADVRVVSVDLPSGINGANGAVLGAAIQAEHTVTFFRRKPGHLLFPGRSLCGAVSCVDIGIAPGVLFEISPKTCVNAPALWRSAWQAPQISGHKYARGHAVVLSGPVRSTGAARLAAGAALRAGAGLVTLATPPSALLVNAAQLTAVMVQPVAGADGLAEFLKDRRLNAVVAGPGYGIGEKTCDVVRVILEAGRAVVLDADALTSFADAPERLFDLIASSGAPVVLTPHGGEFCRLFPGLTDLARLNRLEAARRAASARGAVIVLKGADTVIAAPDGRAAINENASPWLATAGSGDVLAGIICGLLAQSVPGFEAASMGVWLHSEAGTEAGPGLIAEDLAPALKSVISRLVENAPFGSG